MAQKTVLVTGANGYIGNAVARAFVAAGWITYGLIRSPSSATALAQEEIIPIIGNIDDTDSHPAIQNQLPPTLNAIVSTTENVLDYIPHYTNTIRLLRALGTASSAAGIKPLVIFSSGCKDYGVGPHYHGAAGLAPHTESSPLNPPPLLAPRAAHAAQIFDHADAFSPVLVRPTNVYGRSSSYYRAFLAVASKTAANNNKPLIVPQPPNTILHALHVDDCAEAYVAIASHPVREQVEGQVFNISARRYETLDEVCQALVKEYGIRGGMRYVKASDEPNDKADEGKEDLWPAGMIDFPQWTDSSKLRRVTGWRDRRPLFSEAVHVYRMAAEAAEAAGHENVRRVDGLFGAWGQGDWGASKED